MGTWPRSWWQYIKQHPVAIGVIGFVLVLVIVLIIAEVWFNGTGFNGYNQVTVAHTTSGPSAGTVVRTEVYQPGKALWDWMQLLIIPAVLVVGGFLLNYTTSRNERQANEQRAQTEREAAEKRAQTERDIALDNQREAALQDYIDNMSELLLEKKLRKSGEDDEVRTIARVRTLTVLPRLDGNRKASVLQFLYESGLIEKDKIIIDLQGADLNGADLMQADLRGADLSRANLLKANLNGANLEGATMEGTNLEGANLNGVNLEGANLSGPILHIVGVDVDDPVAAVVMEANLTGAKLSRASLVATRLVRADLSRADLSRAALFEANLQEANLCRACLSRANLERTNLERANLYGAVLYGADLAEANLEGANLEGVDLGRANLRGAIVTPEQLDTTWLLEGATMPDGTKHD